MCPRLTGSDAGIAEDSIARRAATGSTIHAAAEILPAARCPIARSPARSASLGRSRTTALGSAGWRPESIRDPGSATRTSSGVRVHLREREVARAFRSREGNQTSAVGRPGHRQRLDPGVMSSGCPAVCGHAHQSLLVQARDPFAVRRPRWSREGMGSFRSWTDLAGANRESCRALTSPRRWSWYAIHSPSGDQVGAS